MRFSISIHQFDVAGFDAAGQRDYLARAEELGFEGGWVLEQIVGEAPGGGFRQFSAFGVDKAAFISSFTEGLALMKAAWSDEPRVTFDGRFRQVDDVPIQPKPVQRPHPPIWFGGQAPKALARAVRHGDAFLGAGSSSTAKFSEAAKTVRRE